MLVGNYPISNFKKYRLFCQRPKLHSTSDPLREVCKCCRISVKTAMRDFVNKLSNPLVCMRWPSRPLGTPPSSGFRPPEQICGVVWRPRARRRRNHQGAWCMGVHNATYSGFHSGFASFCFAAFFLPLPRVPHVVVFAERSKIWGTDVLHRCNASCIRWLKNLVYNFCHILDFLYLFKKV